MATLKKKYFKPSWETTTTDKGTWSYDKAEMKFYQAPHWRKLRALILEREPLCRECNKEGRITEAKMVDHIKPIRLGGERIDEDNLQPLCHSCHNTKSAKERHKK